MGEFCVSSTEDSTEVTDLSISNNQTSLFDLPDLTYTTEDHPNLIATDLNEEKIAETTSEDHPTVQTEEMVDQIADIPDMENTSDLAAETSSSTLEGVRFAPVPKKRGRLKGACTTAIGLPQKRRKIKDNGVPYHRKNMQTKEKYVLGLFVDPSSYLEGVLLGEQAVERVPENLASALLDEHLDINLIKKFFDGDGWEAVIRAHEARKQQPWRCLVCGGDLHDACPSIGCDSCLNWCHWDCVGLTKKPRKKFWFCKDCQ